MGEYFSVSGRLRHDAPSILDGPSDPLTLHRAPDPYYFPFRLGHGLGTDRGGGGGLAAQPCRFVDRR